MLRMRKRFALLLVLGLFIQGMNLISWKLPSVEAAYDPAIQPSQIASGNYYTLFMSTDGTVKASGFDGGYGGMGLGSTTSSYSTPKGITGLTNVSQIAVYGYSSYALLQDGTVKSWGQGNSYQLGSGSTSNIFTPTTIAGLTNVKQIAAGNGFAIALLQDGTLKGWGTNAYGELPLGTSTTPTLISGIRGVKQIALGDKFVVALMQDGTVKTWGYNANGQLGLGNADTTAHNVPTSITNLSNVIQVAAGSSYAMALMKDGTVKAWGNNANGQLGNNSTTISNLPVIVTGLSNARYIAAGGASSVAVLQDDSISVWGINGYGQLGLGDTTERLTPTPVILGFRVAHAYVGSNSSNQTGIYIVDYDFKVYAAGYNGYGQLGTGDTTTRNVFTNAVGLQVPSYALSLDSKVSNNVISLYSGPTSNSSFIQYNGQVFSWGYNYSGQLGLGNNTNQLTPTVVPGLTGVQQLVAGSYHTLALMADGTVKAWGYNSDGELGLGSTTNKVTPTAVPGLTGVRQLVAGSYHTFALMADGTVKAWGDNNYGQLGLGNTTNQLTPTTVPGLTGVQQLVTGSSHTLALMADGTVKAWGYNNYGQLGLGNTTNQLTPTTVPGLTGVQLLVAGNYYTLALMTDGTVKAWGSNSYGQLGLGNTTNQLIPTTVPGLTGVQQLVAGSYHTLAIMADGTVKVWGYNGYGQLGLGNTTNQLTPTTVPGLTGVQLLVAGNYYTLALMTDGTVKAWGYNSYGQLGLGNTTNQLTPTTVPGLTGVQLLVAGNYYTLALMTDGTVKAWGYNSYGQLGLGNTTNQLTPTTVPGLTGVKQLVAGTYDTLALMVDGTVMAWGSNSYGQLGLGNTTDQLTPTTVPGLTGVKQLVAGAYHTLALMADGTVKAWGYNNYGQLGLGNTTNQLTPTTVPGLTGVQQLVAGDSHTLALMTDGTVKAWGSNSGGELGLGNTAAQLTPTRVPGLTGVKLLAAGSEYTLALMTDGTVKAWGYNDDGLGLGNTAAQLTPMMVPGLTGVKQLVAGSFHTLALMADGTVKAWGSNIFGALGLGNTTPQLTPTTVPGLMGVQQLVAGSFHTLALMADGTVKAWGYNNYGQLGFPGNRYVPTIVNQFVVDRVAIQAAINGPINDRIIVSYYLDNESEPREQTTAVLTDGTATVQFLSLPKSLLSAGTHTIRITVNTAYQTTTQTLAFTVDDGSYSYPINVTPTSNNITVQTNAVDTMSNLAAKPYRFMVGTQSSGWVAPTTTLNGAVNASGALDMPGTGNKKIIKLANGWWVVAGYTGNATTGINILVSKNQGVTWSLLCTLTDPDNIASAPAIAASGNNVIGLVRYGNTSIRAFTIDATSQANENIIDKTTNVDIAQTDIPAVNNVGLTADGSGNIYATWVSKNATYANSYNLRYAKSNDYGLTWSAVQQISTVNTTNYAYSNPSIVLINNLPSIFSEYTNGSSYYLFDYSYTGSAWKSVAPVSVGTYPQQNYSVYVDGSTVYWAWSGTDSTDTTAKNIHLVTSTNGGTTWTSIKLTSGNTYSQQLPVITKDSQNKLYIVYSGIDPAVSATSYNLRMITSTDGTTWSAPTTLTNYTTGNADQPVVPQDFKLNYVNNNPVIVFKDSGNNLTSIRGTVETGTQFTATGLTPNTSYKAALDVQDASGKIRTSSQDVYTLAVRPAITIQQNTGHVPVLTITDTNPATTKYQIVSGGRYLSSEGQLVNQPVSLTLPSKTLTLSKLDAKKNYQFKIRALNQDGVATDWSATIQVGPPLVPPAAPKNIKVQPTSNQVTISWSPVTNATSYDIEIDGQAALVNNGRSLSYVSTGLIPNTLHQYRIRAEIDGTLGAWSAPINIRTLMVTPVMPTQIVATTTAKTVTLSWGAVKDALAYEVEWDGQVISTGKSETFHQEGLPVASRHAYRIRAINAGGESPWSLLEIVSTLANVPGAPTFSAPHAGNDSVTLTWTALPDALTYDIEADGVVMSFGDSKTATFTGLTPKTHHQYRVRAVNELGAGDWSSLMDVTTHLLSTPSVMSEQLSDQSISFAWSTVPDAASYDVEVDGASVNVSSTSYSQTGLAPETTHTYCIRAVNDDGDSAWTDAFTYSTLPQKPNMPSSLSATATKDEVFIVWSPVDNVVGYDVEIDGKVVVDNFTDTSYTDILLSPFSNHTYRVRARTDAIEGDWSPLVSVKTMPDVPSAPRGIAATSAGNIVTLHWNADPTVTKYEVEVDGQAMDAGTKPEYKHRRVVAGTEHKYRIRTINVSGTSPWSGYIINNTITAKLTKGGTVDVGLAGVDVMDFSRYTLQVTYDPNAIDITDLSELTAQKELTVGRIAGTDITVTSFSPGLITFTTDKVISIDESWTGVINSIQMKAKVSGGSSLTYSVIENTETTMP